MFLKKRERVFELISTICELINYVYESKKIEMFDDIVFAINTILKSFEEEFGPKENTIEQLYKALDLCNIAKNKKDKVGYDELNNLIEQINLVEETIIQEIEVKLNVVFMPYNITMWDSLESIYLACKEDKECVARVVPIPFYDISGEVPVENYHFDQYDKSIDAIHYKDFDLENEEPDIIYIHNIYDDGNILTYVHPDYHTSNIKKYTNMLVYSPYCVPNFRSVLNEDQISYTFSLKGAKNVDRFISAGDFVLNEGLKLGVDRKKILNLGCPKFDSIILDINKKFDFPEDWLKKAQDRRVVVWATALNYFIAQHNPNVSNITNNFLIMEEFGRMMCAFRENNIFVIWRPHPLTRNWIQRSQPYMVEWYDYMCEAIKNNEHELYSNIALDMDKSYLKAFAISDALVTSGTSIIYPYLLLNKQLILSGDSSSFVKVGADLESGKITFLHEDNTNIFKRVTDFKSTGEIEVDNKFLSKFYKNLDGTVGKKIHYAVKNDLINKNL